MYYVKGCGFRSVHYIEVKFVLRCPFGCERLSVIENWEVVHSLEVPNVNYAKFNLFRQVCLLYRDCPLLGGSITGSFTVYSVH